MTSSRSFTRQSRGGNQDLGVGDNAQQGPPLLNATRVPSGSGLRVANAPPPSVRRLPSQTAQDHRSFTAFEESIGGDVRWFVVPEEELSSQNESSEDNEAESVQKPRRLPSLFRRDSKTEVQKARFSCERTAVNNDPEALLPAASLSRKCTRSFSRTGSILSLASASITNSISWAAGRMDLKQGLSQGSCNQSMDQLPLISPQPSHSKWNFSQKSARRKLLSKINKKNKSVKWDESNEVSDPPCRALFVWDTFLSVFHPKGRCIKFWTDFKIVLHIYELWMLPLRVAWGTGYGRMADDLACYALLDTSWMYGWGLWVDLSFDALFLFDIVVNILSKMRHDRHRRQSWESLSDTNIVSPIPFAKSAIRHTGRILREHSRSIQRKIFSRSTRNNRIVPILKNNDNQQGRPTDLQRLPSMLGSVPGNIRLFGSTRWAGKSANKSVRTSSISTINQGLGLESFKLRRLSTRFSASSAMSVDDLGVRSSERVPVRNPKLRQYLLRRAWVDLVVCGSIYLPVIFRWPIWTWWLASIPRIQRPVLLYQYFRSKELMVHLNIRFIAFFKFIITVAGTAHWVGCLFFLLARLSGFAKGHVRANWMEQFYERSSMRFGCEENETVLASYLLTLYKGLNGLTNLGYDIGVPQRADEMALSIMVILLQIIIEAYILGTLVNYVVKKDPSVEAFRGEMQALSRYSESRRLPERIKQRLVSYYEFQHQRNVADDVALIIRALPPSLRMRVASHQYNKTIQRNDFIFKGCSTQFLNQVMIRLREVYLMPGEITIREGEMARELLFVTKGIMEELHDDVVIKSVREDTEAPNVAGFSAFFMGISQPRTLQAKATGSVNLLVFSRMEYDELVAMYPEQHDVITTNLLAYYELDRDGNEHSFSSGDEEALTNGNAFATEKTRVKKMIQAAVKKRKADAMRSMILAALEGDVDTVRSYLKRGLDVNTQDYDGRTTLLMAAQRGNVKVVEVLLQENADPNVRDRWGHTSLQRAVANKHGPVIQMLQKFHAKLGHVDPSLELCAAAGAGDMRQLTRLIENGVDPNCKDYDGRTSLHVAASRGNLSVVEYLLGCTSDPNAIDGWGQTSLQAAVLAGHEIVAQVIRSWGGRLSFTNPAQIFGRAAVEGDVNMIQLLVSNGVYVDTTDYDGRTALHLSAVDGQLATVYTLIYRCDASVNIKDRWGATPLAYALKNDHLLVAKLIFSAEGNLGDTDDSTLLEKFNGKDVPDLSAIRSKVSTVLQNSANANVDVAITNNYSLGYSIVVESIKVIGKALSLGHACMGLLTRGEAAMKSLRTFLELLCPSKVQAPSFGPACRGYSFSRRNKMKANVSRRLLRRFLTGTRGLLKHSSDDSQAQLRSGTSMQSRFSSSNSITAGPFPTTDKLLLRLGTVEVFVASLMSMINDMIGQSAEAMLNNLCNVELDLHLGTGEIRDLALSVWIPHPGTSVSCAEESNGAISIPAFLASPIIQRAAFRETRSSRLEREFGDEASCGLSKKEMKQALNVIHDVFNLLDRQRKGLIDIHEIKKMKLDARDIVMQIIDQDSGGSDDQQCRRYMNNEQFVWALLSWMDLSADKSTRETFGTVPVTPSTTTKNPYRPPSSAGSQDSGYIVTAPPELLKGPYNIDHFIKQFRYALDNQKSDEGDKDAGRRYVIDRLFRVMDQDRNGYVTRQEVNNALDMFEEVLGMDMSHINRQELFETADLNKDNLVSFEEFVKVLAPPYEHRPQSTTESSTVRVESRGASVPRMWSSVIIMPSNRWITAWDRLVRWLAVFFFVDVPMQISFRSGRPGTPYFVVSNTFDCLLIVDMVLHFFRAYTNKRSVVVKSLPRIARHYLGSKFLIDFIAASPLDLLVMTAGASQEYMAWLRLPKLLRLHRLYAWYKKKESDMNADTVLARIKLLVPVIFCLSHIMACIWWYIGTSDLWEARDDPQTYEKLKERYWIHQYSGLGMEDIFLQGSTGEQYLLSFYWVTATLSTNGQVGSMYPTNIKELVFTSVCMLLTLTVYAYILGEISNLVMNQDEELVSKRTQLQTVQKFVSNNHLEGDLATDILNYFDNAHSKDGKHAADGKEIFKKLSHTLQVDVAKYLSRGLLAMVSTFRGCNEKFLDSLSILFHEVVVPPDSYLFRAKDISRELYIVAGGVVELTIDDPEEGEVLQAVRTPGQLVGEMAFFFNMQQTMDAKTPQSMSTTLFSLHLQDFQQLVKLYPEEDHQLIKNMLKSWENQRSMGPVDESNAPRVPKVLERAREKKNRERVQRLIEGASKGDVEEVDSMLDNADADVDIADFDHRTALHLASSNGHLEMVRHLVVVHHAHVNVLDRHEGTPIMDAMRHKHPHVVAFLRKQGALLQSKKAKSALFAAAGEGDETCVRMLIDNGIDPNVRDYNQRTALHVAASKGHLHIVRFLCSHPDIRLSLVDRMGGTPLRDGIQHRHRDIQQFLLSCGAKLEDPDIGFKLCEAAARNDLDRIKVLHENGADINSPDRDLRTALHLAASNGSTEVALYLLRDPRLRLNPKDKQNFSPMDDAVRSGDLVMQAMLERAEKGRKTDMTLPPVEKQPTTRIERKLPSNQRKVVETSAEGRFQYHMSTLHESLLESVGELLHNCQSFEWMLQEILEVGQHSKPTRELQSIVWKSHHQVLHSIHSTKRAVETITASHLLQSPLTKLLCKGFREAVSSIKAHIEILPGLIDDVLKMAAEGDYMFDEWQFVRAKRPLAVNPRTAQYM